MKAVGLFIPMDMVPNVHDEGDALGVREAVEEALVPDDIERFLVLVLLRRYIAWCARCRRFAQMNGAVRLFAEVRCEQ